MKLDHIGIAVRSLEAALPVYRDGLGLAPQAPEEVAGMGVRVVKLPVGDATLELIEGTAGDDGTIERFIARRGEGIHHIALRVDDVLEATRQLAERGYSPVYEAPRAGADGHRVNFLRPAQTHGVLIELVEVHDAS